MLGGLNAAAQLAGPHLQVLQLLLVHKASQGSGELQQAERQGSVEVPSVETSRLRRPQAYLSASWRQARIATQPPLHVVRALSVPTQVDGAWLDVNVYQVIDDFTLDVILDTVDEETAAHVYDFDEGEFPGRRRRRRREHVKLLLLGL